jgi:hypothetical protein
MNDARAEMNTQLKAVVVPHLRSLGFRVSLPHFRRLSESGTELLTFQFSMSGPRFVVEAAFRAPYKVTAMWGDHIPPEKLTAHHINDRERVGKKILDISDPWFDFGAGKYDEVCQQVISALPEADDYWRKKKEAQPGSTDNSGAAPRRV